MLYAIDTQQIVLIVLVILLVLVLIVMPIFTNKKRQQSVNTLHNSLKVGDKVMTIGGIIGTVTDIKQTSPVDKVFTIETGEEGSKTTMTLDIKALYQVMVPSAAPDAPVAAEVSDPVDKATVTDVFDEVAAPAAESEPVADESKVEEKEASETSEPASETEKTEETKTESKPRGTRKPISKK